MLAVTSLSLNQWKLMLGARGPQASRERFGHVTQLVVIGVGVAAVDLPPPRA
jgi:hypothetical protein